MNLQKKCQKHVAKHVFAAYICTIEKYIVMESGAMRESISQSGQGMTEYIVIVALIAVAAIAVYQFFGETVRSQTAGIALEVSGKSASAAISSAQSSADNAEAEGTTKKGLNAYTNDNSR